MRARHKGMALLALAAAGALAVSACAGSSNNNGGGGSGGGKTQVIYGSDEAPANWQPFISAGNGVATAWAEIRTLLAPFVLKPDFKVYPDPNLNASPPKVVKNNPFTVQYKINPKAVWNDGTPVSAQDFIYTWEVNDPTSKTYSTSGTLGAKGGCQTIASGYDQVKSVTGSDNDKTVTVTFKAPYPDWQSLFTLLPAHIMKKSTPAATCKLFNAGYSANSPLKFSDGPWVISSVNKTQQTYTLTQNPKWYGPKPKLSKLIYKTVGSDSQTVSQDLQNKEIDFAYPQPQIDLIQLLKQDSSVKTEVNFGLSFEHIDFNTENPYLSNTKFRQALALALDRKSLVAKTVGQFDSRAQVLNNRIFVNNQPGYKDNAPAEYKKPNQKKALQMLESIGYQYQGGKLMKDGKQVEMNIVTTSDNPLRKSTELVVQDQLSKIGIKIDPVQRDADIFFGSNTTQGAMAAGDCDLCLYAWVSAPFLTQNIYIYHSVPKGKNGKPDRAQEAQNYGLGGDPRVDKVMEQAVKTVNLGQQEALWNQADSLLWQDMFTLPLYQKPTLLPYNPKVQGLGDNATNAGPLWNSDKWSIKQ